ncbi:ABC transporter ATP-binding protein [Catenovulum maritimum]|uniref:ABC transporter domain-containing protein n=1 Tax=Catenovulum maritimum TaxID=1513271 RepID=A0A0J8JPJ4_9ALTE|nr:ABC transporter ATP-binding protein [Catenovulum maritimum]KMT66566.1 hypothetical protein XM47_03270 [Catenovulum maritimum]
MSSEILRVNQLSKTVTANGNELKILHECDLTIFQGETVAIIGRSGSGKSTLLSLLAGLDTATSGEVYLAGQAVHQYNEEQRAKLRADKVGFVFQSFMLVQSLTALENVMLPLELSFQKDAHAQAVKLLDEVGLTDRASHYPNQLSGGEQQRVAIARAFASRPALLFADEPTGNLDSENADLVEDLLFKLNQEQGTTLVIVTHDPELAQRCEKQFKMHSGQLSIVEALQPALVDVPSKSNQAVNTKENPESSDTNLLGVNQTEVDYAGN